jgi:hypothetical protein
MIEVKAIKNTHPTVITINGGTQAWDEKGNEVILDRSLIDTEVTRLQAEYDAAQYARDRAEAYPSIADQLDKIYHSGVAGWKATIQLTKDKYPKEGN